MAIIKQMSRQVSSSSDGDYQAEEQAGVARFSWRISSRLAGRSHASQLAIIKQMSMQGHAAQMAIIRQMSRKVSSSSAGDYQAEEQGGVARLSCRLSST